MFDQLHATRCRCHPPSRSTHPPHLRPLLAVPLASAIVHAQPIRIFLHKSVSPSLPHTFLRKLTAQPCLTDCIDMFF